MDEQDGMIAQDWKKMYMTMVDGVETALEFLPEKADAAQKRLIQALQDAEEQYINAGGI